MPIPMTVSHRDKMRIDKGFSPVITQRLMIYCENIATALLQNHLCGGGIPFAGIAKAKIAITLLACYQRAFQTAGTVSDKLILKRRI